MMKEKELFNRLDLRGFRYTCTLGETESQVRDFALMALEKVNAETWGLPISITADSVKAGGLLSSREDPAIVISNTNERYFDFVIRFMPKQGNICHSQIVQKGYSDTWGKNTSGLMASLTGIKSRMENEINYYRTLRQMIDDALKA